MWKSSAIIWLVLSCSGGSPPPPRSAGAPSSPQGAPSLAETFADRVTAPIDARANSQAVAIGRVRDQIDDGLVGAQRTAAPVDGDEREQPVLNFSPARGSGDARLSGPRDSQLD